MLLLYIACIIAASLFGVTRSFVSPLCNRRGMVHSRHILSLKPRIFTSNIKNKILLRAANANANDDASDDIFGDFDIEPRTITTNLEALASSTLGDTDSSAAVSPEWDSLAEHSESPELDSLGENSAESDRSRDGARSAESDISEIPNSIEERIPAYALLYKFQKGFTTDGNPLAEEHEEYCDNFNTLINSELLSLEEDHHGAVLLWGSMNSTAAAKAETREEIKRFQLSDPLNDMLEKFEIIDLSPDVSPDSDEDPHSEGGSADDNLASVASSLERFRHLGDLFEDNH